MRVEGHTSSTLAREGKPVEGLAPGQSDWDLLASEKVKPFKLQVRMGSGDSRT